MIGINVSVHVRFPLLHVGNRHLIYKAVARRPQTHDLPVKRHRLELGLLENFLNPIATIQLALCHCIQITAELGKGSQFAELAQL